MSIWSKHVKAKSVASRNDVMSQVSAHCNIRSPYHQGSAQHISPDAGGSPSTERKTSPPGLVSLFEDQLQNRSSAGTSKEFESGTSVSACPLNTAFSQPLNKAPVANLLPCCTVSSRPSRTCDVEFLS